MNLLILWISGLQAQMTVKPLSPMNLLILWISGLQAQMTVKPLSPLYIWVHIIENENKFYRKRDY